MAPEQAHPHHLDVVPILTFVQMILPGLGRWGGAFHPLNAILVLGLFAWLFYRLRQEQPAEPAVPAPATV